MNLRVLREETQDQHNAVEAMLPLTGDGLDREQYGVILQCFYRAVQGWEVWAGIHGPPQQQALVRGRQRAGLLLRDLYFLGLAPLEDTREDSVHLLDALLAGKEQSSPEYEAAFLGTMYVMEGSTLGGQYIASHVEKHLGLAPGEGDAYFRGYGDQTGAMWNAFRQILSAVSDEHSSTVIAAAQTTFGYVQSVMRSCPAACDIAVTVLS